ncbi:hypothetical protein RJ639_006268 [Escallonia herrerae]|uniref:Uncharacterized protein n=1 Tax=Escallonia herrerae TaxID=1293975 RepID=A0AA88VXZ3_9ASTE|nr:hypothetical protein RJ639_006268 [Escallonia herrerae]
MHDTSLVDLSHPSHSLILIPIPAYDREGPALSLWIRAADEGLCSALPLWTGAADDGLEPTDDSMASALTLDIRAAESSAVLSLLDTPDVLQRPSVKDSGLYMKGTLSPSRGSLHFLEVMVISGMQQIGGVISQSFSNLTRLTQLVLEDNALIGNIPSSLDLSDNLIMEGISNFFPKLSSWQNVKLSNNQLKFDLTKSTLPSGLSSLGIDSNLMFGSLSRIINGQTSSFVHTIDVSNNQISGNILESAEGFNLKLLNVAGNRITGQLPSSITNLVRLGRLDISINQITA